MERPFFFARVVLAVWIMALCSACAWAEDIVDIALPNMRNPERQNARILAYRIKALETWQNADNAKSARKVNPDELKQMRGILKERPVEASRVGAVQDVLGQTLADPGNAGWKEDLDALKERMKAYAKEKGLEFAEDGYRKLQEFVRNRRAGLSKDIDAMRLGREVSGYIENILRYEDAPGDASIYSYEKFRQNSDPELTPRELAVIGHQIRRKLPLKIRGEEFKSLDYLHLLGLLAEHDRTVNLMQQDGVQPFVGTSEVSFTLISRVTRKPVVGASVFLTCQSRKKMRPRRGKTNAEGTVSFKKVACGRHVLKASAKGYEPIVRRTFFIEDDPFQRTVSIVPMMAQLKVRVVSAFDATGEAIVNVTGPKVERQRDTEGGVATFRLPEGRYRVMAVLDRVGDKSATVDIYPYEQAVYDITLRIGDGVPKKPRKVVPVEQSVALDPRITVQEMKPTAAELEFALSRIRRGWLGETPYQMRKVYNYSYEKRKDRLTVSHGLVIVYTIMRRVYEGPNEVKRRRYGYAVLGPGKERVSPLIKNPPAYLFGYHREYQTAEKRDDVLNELWPYEGRPDAAQLKALLEKCRKE